MQKAYKEAASRYRKALRMASCRLAAKVPSLSPQNYKIDGSLGPSSNKFCNSSVVHHCNPKKIAAYGKWVSPFDDADI